MSIQHLFSPHPVSAILFCDGVFSQSEAKTAQGIIRHSTWLKPVAVVDRHLEGESTAAVVPNSSIPVVGSVTEALQWNPQALVIAMTESDYGEWENGVFIQKSRRPGDLPDFWTDSIKKALSSGLDIISCLHVSLKEYESYRVSSSQQIIDIRQPARSEFPKYSGRIPRSRANVIHIAGSDCVIGKRTTALQLHRFVQEQGTATGYIGTGQTCLLAGCAEGAVMDQTPLFFGAGLMEDMIHNVESDFDVIFTKGQASVFHPAFGGLANAILQGSQPNAIVFVHDPRRTQRYHWEHLPLAPLDLEIETIERLSGAPVVAIATRGEENVRQLRIEQNLPVGDPLNEKGLKVIGDAIKPYIPQSARV